MGMESLEISECDRFPNEAGNLMFLTTIFLLSMTNFASTNGI